MSVEEKEGREEGKERRERGCVEGRKEKEGKKGRRVC